jgi:hypothetical protein
MTVPGTPVKWKTAFENATVEQRHDEQCSTRKCSCLVRIFQGYDNLKVRFIATYCTGIHQYKNIKFIPTPSVDKRSHHQRIHKKAFLVENNNTVQGEVLAQCVRKNIVYKTFTNLESRCLDTKLFLLFEFLQFILSILYTTACCIRKYCDLLWNVYFPFTLGNVTCS